MERILRKWDGMCKPDEDYAMLWDIAEGINQIMDHLEGKDVKTEAEKRQIIIGG